MVNGQLELILVRFPLILIMWFIGQNNKVVKTADAWELACYDVNVHPHATSTFALTSTGAIVDSLTI